MRIDIRTMGAAVKDFKVYLDAQDISSDCFAADDEKGVAYCYERNKEGRFYIKRNEVVAVERRGRVELRLPETISPEKSAEILSQVVSFNRWGILHPRTWTVRLNNSHFLVQVLGFPLYVINWYLLFDRLYWKDEYPTRLVRLLGAVKHAARNIRSSWGVLVLEMTQEPRWLFEKVFKVQ